MAMGDTGANMAHWGGGLYGGVMAPATTEATVVTAAAAAAGGGSVSSPTSGGSGGGGSPTRSAQPAGVEGGRVGKPARRRSRASRRAPVTLLNTDTSNFRAMVQQFTGIPSVPYGGGPHGAGGGPVISFGAGAGEYGAQQLVRPSPTSAVVSFDHHMAAAQHRATGAMSLQGQLFRPQHQHLQQFGGGDVGAYGMHGGGGGVGGDMAPPFLHGFESSAEDRLLLQSMMQASQTTTMPTGGGGRPASSSHGSGYSFG